MRSKLVGVLVLVVAALGLAAPAAAADAPIEVGTSLASLSVGFGDNDVNLFGIPSSSFGVLSPAVYGSIFMSQNLAIEPQIGLIVASSNHETDHVLNVTGQVDYFTRGRDATSPYLFASFGVIDVSNSDVTPKTFSGGVGYRKPMGGRFVVRADARLEHFTDGGGTALVLSLSIGGLFNSR